MPIKFVEEPFCVSKEFWYRKFSSKGRGSFTVLSKIVLSHRTEKTSPGNYSVFQKISSREKNLWIRGGLSRFSVEIFMSHSAENFRKGILLFLRKLLVSKSFIDEKGGITFFRRNFLSHRTETKSFVKEPFCFPEIFWYQKNFMDKRGLNTIFSQKFFCLTVPRSFVGEPFCAVFQKISGTEKVYG